MVQQLSLRRLSRLSRAATAAMMWAAAGSAHHQPVIALRLRPTRSAAEATKPGRSADRAARGRRHPSRVNAAGADKCDRPARPRTPPFTVRGRRTHPLMVPSDLDGASIDQRLDQRGNRRPGRRAGLASSSLARTPIISASWTRTRFGLAPSFFRMPTASPSSTRSSASRMCLAADLAAAQPARLLLGTSEELTRRRSEPLRPRVHQATPGRHPRLCTRYEPEAWLRGLLADSERHTNLRPRAAGVASFGHEAVNQLLAALFELERDLHRARQALKRIRLARPDDLVPSFSTEREE